MLHSYSPFMAASALLLAACAVTPLPATEPQAPTRERLPVCWGYGCANLDIVSLNETEWQRLRSHFLTPAPDAVEERLRLAGAIGEMERIVGPKTGTDADQGGTFPGLFRAGQMDCIDESTNTTNYLRLFATQGWLHWHTVGEDATRGYFLFGWPHTTATVREKASAREYAVDSWFFDNGADAAVIPLPQWREGWSPPEK